MRQRSALLGIAMAMTVTLLAAGCGSDDQGDAADNPYHLIKSGTLLAATSGDQPPFTVMKDGKPEGFSISLTEAVAKRLGLTTEYKQTDVPGGIQGLTSKQYDMYAGGLGVTAEREKSILFAKGMYWSVTAALTLKKSAVSTMDNLAGKRVAVVTGSVQADYVKKIAGAVATEFPSQNAAVSALHSGDVEAFLVGGPDAEEYLKEFDDLKIGASQPVEHPSTVAFQKTNTALATAYNEQLAALVKDGTYRKIYDQYFTQPPRPELITIWPGLA
jgi:polar amino acid transport system substrate-binding protein